MPSFAELKAKAAKTANSGVEKLQNVKDRNTSVPMKKTNWDPYSGQPPPPPPPPRSLVNQRTKPVEPERLPPPRRSSGASSSGTALPTSRASVSPGPPPPLPARTSSSTPPVLPQRSNPMDAAPPPPSRTVPPIARNVALANSAGPPPVVRSTRPDLAPQESFNHLGSKEIDWTNLSQEDKETFFSWLDEFFSKHLNIALPPRTTANSTKPGASASINLGAPPPLRVSSKPVSWSHATNSGNSDPTNFVISYPPPASNSDGAAADLAAYFSPTTRWDTPWYHTSGVPPSLEGNSDIRYVSSWQSRGSIKTTKIGVLFSDLSVFWGSVTYSMDNPESKTDTKRQCSYLPRPLPTLDRAKLIAAHQTGECWDLANGALKYFEQYDYIPKPVPSISRTHGHLIYEGKADGGIGNGGMVGRWRGGDDRIRRGDIVEWRRVRIVSGSSYSILGDPDHTAVIVTDSKPISTASDGSSIPPSELGQLMVVEQSVGQPPVRKDYNLRGLEEGEIWIYRPIGLEAYLGISDLTPTTPEGLPRMRHA